MKNKYLFGLVVCLIISLSFSLVSFGCPAPTVVSISPDKGFNNQSIQVTITGSKFHKSAYVKLVKEGQADIMAANVQVSKTELTCTLDLNGKALGQWDVVVANIGSFSKKDKPTVLKNAFTIEKPGVVSPVISAIKPAEGLNNASINVTITGSNFSNDAFVKLSKSGLGDIIGSDVKVDSDSQITCAFDLNNAKAGTYDLIVINSDGMSTSMAGAFQVAAAIGTTPPAQNTKTNMDDSTLDTWSVLTDLNDSLKSIFFDFDKSNIRADQIDSVKADLQILKDNPDYYIALGGNADERGTKEYNIKLSARRADSVKKFLVKNGINANRIIVFAYGEDQPIKDGHNESSWWFNRRVDVTLWLAPPTKEEAVRYQE